MAVIINGQVYSVYDSKITVPSAAAASTPPKILAYYVVSSTSTTLRVTPEYSGKLVADLARGTSLRQVTPPLGSKTSTNWVYVWVSTTNKYGWVPKASIEASIDKSNPIIITIPSTALMSAPSLTNSSKITAIPKGEVVYRIAEPTIVASAAKYTPKNDGTWVYVAYKNMKGWIQNSNVTGMTSSPLANIPITTTINPTVIPAAGGFVTPTLGRSISYNVYNVPTENNAKNVNVNGGVLPTDFHLFDSNFQESNQIRKDDSLIGNRSRLIIHTYDANAKAWLARIFEFTVGPSAMTETFSNTVNPIKTGGGFIISKSGPDLNRMTLSGVFLDTKEADERRTFLDSYYNEYLVDKVNAFHDYFNQNRLLLQINGYEYKGVMLALVLNKTAQSLFLYNYNMELIINDRRRM